MTSYLRFFLIALAYFLTAELGLMLTSINQLSSPIWPATGLALAVLYFFDLRFWPAILVGAFCANYSSELPIYVPLIVACGNTAEAYLGVFIIRAIQRWRIQKHELDGEIIGLVTASFLAPAVSATTGTFALTLSKVISSEQIHENWVTWWSGDVVGSLIAFPITLFALRHRPFEGWKKRFRALFIVLVAVVTCIIVFVVKAAEPFIFVLFPILLLASSWAAAVGLYLSFLAVALLSIVFTLSGYGPFVVGGKNDSLMALQLFVGSLALTAYVLAEFRKIIPLKYLARPLLVGWLISGAIFHSYYRQHEGRDRLRLEALAKEYTSRIEAEFRLHRHALRHTAGLFALSSSVSREQWSAFTDSLDLKNRFRAVVGIGFIAPVKKADLPRYVQEQKKTFPQFTVKPVNRLTPGGQYLNEGEHFIIQYLAPVSLERVIGMDMASEAHRYEAAVLSRDLGRSVMSRNISLNTVTKRDPGFLLYVPVYRRGASIATVEERRKAHLGWVYSPLVLDDLIRLSMEDREVELDYEVYLRSEGSRDLLMHSSTGLFSQNYRYQPLQTEFSASEKKFLIRWQPNQKFIGSRDFTLAWVGAMGVLLSLATSWMLMNSQSFMARAESIVREQTRVISESNLLWQALMESAPVGVLHVDVSGGWRYANSKWYAFFGHSEAGTTSAMYSLDNIHPEDKEGVIESWRRSLEKDESFSADFRVIVPGNQIKWVRTIATKINNDHGETIGHVCVAIDLTEQIQQSILIEQERAKLVQAAKMASLGEMAGAMAHEINNPLAIILARIEQIRRLDGPELTAENIRIHCEKIEKTSQRIAKIVRGLRAFSRNSEKDPLEVVSLKMIVEDSLSLCGEKLRQNDIQLNVNIKNDPKVACRPAEISQVLVNLIMNSFDAIEGLENRWIRIELEQDSASARAIVRVLDSGSGIAPEILEKIMNPFFTTKEVGKGTGLGLSISKGIIEAHGGRLTVDQSNSNTCFVFELPLA